MRLTDALLALLLCLSLAAPEALGQQICGPGCPNGYHRLPSDCTKFCICSGGSVIATMSCPAGLFFNDAAQVCDWPQNAPCSPVSSRPPAPLPKTPPPPTPKAFPPPPTSRSPPTTGGGAGKQVAVYWGQYGTEGTLYEACSSGRYDIIMISFLYTFGNGQTPRIDLAGHCVPGQNCDSVVGPDIARCQSLGKKLILSMGGGVGSYIFTSAADAQNTAAQVWSMFLGGSGATRPLGPTPLDGVDLDIEGGSRAFYSDFVTRLKSLASAAGRRVYITAAPQCPYPDAYVGPSPASALGTVAASFDFIFVQFYNNPACALQNSPASFRQWSTWLASANPNGKLFLGVPASPAAAGSGYQDLALLASTLGQIRGLSNFGGVMMWDVHNDRGNLAYNGQPFSAGVRSLLGAPTSPVPAPSGTPPARPPPAANCGSGPPCAAGLCCSQWGYCGTGAAYCG